MLEKFKKRFLILAAGGAFALLVIIFLLVWTVSKPKPGPAPSPVPPKGLGLPKVPQTLGADAQKIKEKLTKTDKKSGDLILVDKENLTIRYLILNDEFIVSVKKAPYDVAKKEAEDWFKAKGFTAGDLCLLRISFGTSKTVMPSFSIKDAIPSGCPIPTVTPLIPPKR